MTAEEKIIRRREARLKWEAANPDYRTEWRSRNIDKVRAYSRKSAQNYRQRNPEKAKQYYEANKEWIAEKARLDKQANPEKYRAKDRRYWSSAKGRAGYLLRGAKQRGNNVSITKEWIQERLDKGKCEVTGIPFVVVGMGDSIKNPWAPSLDQRIAGGGYTPENTQVVVWIYNVAKGSWNHEDVITLAGALLET